MITAEAQRRRENTISSLRLRVSAVIFAGLLCGGIGLTAEPGMVLIPGGEFWRGRVYDWPDTRLPWYPNPLKDDTPVRKIQLDPFFMDEAEVTNERYASFVKVTRHKLPYHWVKGEIPKGAKGTSSSP